MTDAERAAGRRADFHVYYRRDGQLLRELRWKIEIRARRPC
jgi:hypothetical protein